MRPILFLLICFALILQIGVQQRTNAFEKQHVLAFTNSVSSKDAPTSHYSISSAQTENVSKPMIFRVYQENWGSGTPVYILAEGTITSETPKQFYQFARKLLNSYGERPNFVYFNSPGGSLAPALEMGKMIRRLGLDTLVGGKYKAIGKADPSQVTMVNNGVCYSACAYVFLGGVGRRVMESGSFGVHRFYGAKEDSEASAQVTMTLLDEYLNTMGVSRELLTVASLTPSKQMGVLTVKQAQELNVDNSSPPRSEWKLDAVSSGRIYAYTTQRQPLRNATITFFLMKENNIYKGKILYKIKQMVRSPEELVSIFGSTENPSLKIDGQEIRVST